MDDEVTRIESVRRLRGAVAHGVVSTLFLVVLVAFPLAVLAGLRLLGPRSLGDLLVGALAVGNVLALTANASRGGDGASTDRERD